METKEFQRFYQTWSRVHAIINLSGVLMAWLYTMEWVWMTGVLVSMGYYISQIPRFIHFQPFHIGYANLITISRFTLLWIMVMLNELIPHLFLLTGFILVIVLDGVDGFVARRFNQSSRVGELLDMETDSFFVFALSWIHFRNEEVSGWVLVAGGLRYLFEFIPKGKEKREFPPKRVRSTIAVIFFISLLFPFIWKPPLPAIILTISAGLIGGSFLSGLVASWIKIEKRGSNET